MDRQTINVLVAGKNYTLTSSDPPDYVRRVAAFVDRRLSETAAAVRFRRCSIIVSFPCQNAP